MREFSYPTVILLTGSSQSYGVLTPKAVPRGFEESRITAERMCTALELRPDDFRIGLTKVQGHESVDRPDLT